MVTIGKTRRPLGREPRGVLHRLAVGEFAHWRAAPPADLADWVEHFWRVSWNLEGLPHPNVHIVIEPGAAVVWGVHTGRWTRVLEGRSSAFGIKFRPGAFRPLLGRPVASLMDGSVSLESLFGSSAGQLNEVLACDEEAASVEIAARFLRGRLPTLDERRCSPAALSAARLMILNCIRPRRWRGASA